MTDIKDFMVLKTDYLSRHFMTSTYIRDEMSYSLLALRNRKAIENNGISSDLLKNRGKAIFDICYLLLREYEWLEHYQINEKYLCHFYTSRNPAQRFDRNIPIAFGIHSKTYGQETANRLDYDVDRKQIIDPD